MLANLISAVSEGWCHGTHMKSHLAREVIHATGVHETQRVSYCLSAQDALACDWTDPSVGQGGSHYTSWLAGHLDGAKLWPKEDQFMVKAIEAILITVQSISGYEKEQKVILWKAPFKAAVHLKVEVQGIDHVCSRRKTLGNEIWSSWLFDWLKYADLSLFRYTTPDDCIATKPRTF